MSEFGLTAAGLKRARIEDVKAQLETAIRDPDAFGPRTNVAPDSVFGQIIGIVAKVVADLWEAIEDVYLAAYRSTAEGVSLDKAVETIGVRRNDPTRTSVPGVLYGAEGAAISDLIASTETGDRFDLIGTAPIARSALLVADVEVIAALPSTTYAALLNGVLYSVTSDADPTTTEIATALAAALGADSSVIASTAGAVVTLQAADGRTPFGIGPQGNALPLTRLGAPGMFDAQEVGAIPCPTGALTDIETPKPGLDSIANLVDGAVGRALEEDEELRARAGRSVRVTGSATVAAMQARLRQEVDSVVTAIVYENRYWEIDASGRPPKSFEAIVDGGDDQEVAEKIWSIKPAGIEPFGNTNRVVIDSNGDPQIVGFSRPEDVFIWVDIAITQYLEEQMPATAAEGITAAAVAFGSAQPIGKDALPLRLVGPIFRAVPGIENMIIRIASGDPEVAPDLGEFTTSPIAINERSIGRYAAARVTVSIP